MLSESKRMSIRQRGIIQTNENFDLLEDMRNELEMSKRQHEEQKMHNPSVSFQETPILGPMTGNVPETPSATRDESNEEKTEGSNKSNSSRKSMRSSIRMSLTPTSKVVASPTNSRKKSVLKGGNFWKADKDRSNDSGAESDGSGQSRLKVKSAEQMEREMVDFQEHERLKKELVEVTAERDALKEDKETWLARLKADNVKLAGMLMHIKGLKSKLVSAVDEVVTEKMALRAMKIDYLHTSLENYLLGDDCAVSESRRALLPAMKKDSAKRFCDNLMGLAATCRANQAELLQYVTELVKDAEAGFVRGDHMATEEKMMALKNIASTKPGTVASAQAVAESLTEGMVGAMIDKANETLMKRGEHLLEMEAGQDASSKQNARAERLEEEMKTVMNQNESLKANVASLRKKYNTLLEKASAKNMSGASKEGSLFTDESPNRGRSLSPNKGGKDMLGKSKRGESGGRGSDADSHSHAIVQALPVVPPVNVTAAFDELPFEVRKEAHELLAQYVSTVVANHPLGKGMRAIVIKETVNDVTEQLHGTMGVALVAFRDQLDVHLEKMKKEERKQYLVRAVQIPSLQTEASVYVHMLLTYLYSRYKSAEPSKGGSSKSALPPSAAGAGAAPTSTPGAGGSAEEAPLPTPAPLGPSSSTYMAMANVQEEVGTGSDKGSESNTNAPAAGMPRKPGAASSQQGAVGGTETKPLFKPATRASVKPAKKKAPQPGSAASTQGTGASGNVFFASSLDAEPEEVVFSLEPSPQAPMKTQPDPNLPKFMQPVPKKKDRR